MQKLCSSIAIVLKAILVLSSMTGCYQMPPASTVAVASAPVERQDKQDRTDRIERLDGEIAELKTMLAEIRSAKSAAEYTGAIAHVASGWPCPPCKWLVRDLEASAKDGWTIGNGPNDHFRLKGHTQDEDVEVPYIEYFKDGKKIDELHGYAGDINQVLTMHPKCKKKPKKATGVQDYGTTYGTPVYGQPVYGAPVYYDTPVWSAPMLMNRDSAPVTFQTDYFFGIPVRQRQCVGGVCW